MTTVVTTVAVAWAITFAGACGKSKDGAASAPGAASGGPAHLSGTPRTDKVIESLQGAGLRPDGFAVLQPTPFGAGYCEQGRIQGIDTVVCEFPDDASLDHGQKLIQEQWDREGVQTGVATATKRTLLGVADRGHHDPNGKTISQILAVFRKI
jgi:hypothetical protein